MYRPVNFRCPLHGRFTALLHYGYRQPAPPMAHCPLCGSASERSARAKTVRIRRDRRTLSIRGEIYNRLKAWCEANGRTVGGMVDELTRGDGA